MITTEEQFRDWLTRNHEQFGIEFKGPAPLQKDKGVFGKILGAAMRMANRRDGGVIVIGVDEDRVTHAYLPTGLSDVDLVTWDYDELAEQFARYTEPTIMFDLEIFPYEGKKFIVLYIQEFDDMPIICRKDYTDSSGATILKEGSIYCRSRGKPQVTEKITYQDMRTLLQLATEKSVRRFVESGISISPSTTLPQDRELFAAQNADWTGGLLDKIRSRGYWQVTVRPTTFTATRISNYSSLYDLLRNAQVHLPGYGWPFPYMEMQEKTERKQDYISQKVEFLSTLEAWRFYQSGQFVHVQGIQTDWMENEKHQPVPAEWKAIRPDSALLVSETLHHFTMLYELAARLAVSDLYAGEQEIHIEVEIHGLAGRMMGYGFNNRLNLRKQYTTAMETFKYPATRFSRSDVIARSKALALDATLQVCDRFGKKQRRGELALLQEELFRPFGS